MTTENDLALASTKKRLASFAIDDMVVAILLFIIFYDQIMLMVSHVPRVLTAEAMERFQYEMQLFNSNNLLFILILKMLYHTFLTWQNNGMTLGKYIMKIRVIELNTNQAPRFLQALSRSFLRLLSEIFFYLGFLLAFFLPLKQTLHDKLSGCVVIDA